MLSHKKKTGYDVFARSSDLVETDNTDNHNMDNSKHSAHYQVSLFLRSKDAEIFDLNAHHRLLLRVIADYIDLPLGYCCVKQTNLASECGISIRQLKIISVDLEQKTLILRVISRKLYRYYLGEYFTHWKI